jgi:hypothetical protein
LAKGGFSEICSKPLSQALNSTAIYSQKEQAQVAGLAKCNHASDFYLGAIHNLESGSSFSLKRVQFAELANDKLEITAKTIA